MALRDCTKMQRFVVVRSGSKSDVAALSDFYDPFNVHTVASDEMGPFLDGADEALELLSGSASVD